MDATEFLRKLENNEDTKVEFHKQLYTKQLQTAERLKMIESVYSIKPSDILANVALDKAEGRKEPEEEEGQTNETSPTKKKIAGKSNKASLSPT